MADLLEGTLPLNLVAIDIADPLGFSRPTLARVFRRFGPGGARQKRHLTGEFSRRQVFESR
ncbi:hypothetical protein, partial [Burkholderia gladioli]|uniref:hypothetical protein n=1 Tax=Burkholderia gladioli TaxID=28095 RepID=UPI001ABA6063